MAQVRQISYILSANVIESYESEFEFLARHLCALGVDSVRTISHPLERRSGSKTHHQIFLNGVLSTSRSWRRPHRPPYTHIFDLFYPPKLLRGDIWIAFNPAQAAIARLRMNRECLLVHWAIDFVPQKSLNPFINFCYRFLERFMFKRVDVQIENTHAAMEMRQKILKRIPPYQAIAPIGVFDSDFKLPTMERLQNPRIVYFGSIDKRNDVEFGAEIAREICTAETSVTFHFVGSGPLEEKLKHQLSDLLIDNRVVFHGFVKDQLEITNLLGECAVAVAPFLDNDKQFTKFADPQKIKYYLAAGLPIILTDVPPNAQDLVDRAGGSILSKQDGPKVWAEHISFLIHSPAEWLSRAAKAYQVGTEYERTKIYDRTLNLIAVALAERRVK
jgi:glycosyltransferase involved in cell wall biosynthesis